MLTCSDRCALKTCRTPQIEIVDVNFQVRLIGPVRAPGQAISALNAARRIERDERRGRAAIQKFALGHCLGVIRPMIDAQQLVQRVRVRADCSRPRPTVALIHDVAKVLNLAGTLRTIRGGRHPAPVQGRSEVAAI